MEKYKHALQDPCASSKLFLLGMIVGLLGFLIYANTFTNGYALDDSFAITKNYLVKQGLRGIPELLCTSYRHGYTASGNSLYRPLPLIMLAVEWNIAPGKASLGHFVNALLYAVTGYFLFLMLHKLFSTYHLIVPFLISILFIVHPVHTEVVANIKSRDEILAFLLSILSLLALLKYVSRKSLTWFIFALCSYFLALLSKESAITFLTIIPLTLYFFTPTQWKQNLRVTICFLCSTIIYLCLRIAVLKSVSASEPVEAINNLLVSAPGIMSRWATAFVIMGKYLALLFFPHPLVIDYSLNQITISTWNNPLAFLNFLLYLGMGIICFQRISKKEIWSYGIFFYLLTFSIYTNLFILIGWHLGERFLYTPSLGFCIVLGFTLLKLLKIPIETRNGRDDIFSIFIQYRRLTVFVIIILVLCITKTITRNEDWKNNFTLFSADLENSPKSARMHYYYGLELMNNKAADASSVKEWNRILDETIDHLTLAASIYPHYGSIWAQLGLASFHKRDMSGAIVHYHKAIELDPTLSQTHNNLGLVYVHKGQHGKAMKHFKKALRIDPHRISAHINLGHTYITLGVMELGIQSYLNGLKYAPNNTSLHDHLASAYKKQGLKIKSEFHLNKAKSLD